MSSQLQDYVTSRDRVLQENDLNSTNGVKYAKIVLFSYELQKISEEILRASAGSCNIDETLQRSLSQDRVWNSAKNNEFCDFAEATLSEMNTHSAPFRDNLYEKQWSVLIFQRQDIRYGLRVGVGVFILCLPAFISQFNHVFHKWHGEWSINVYMIVMVKCMGGMWSDFSLRLFGSTIGALLGLIVTILWISNTTIIVICTSVMSIICFKKMLGDNNPAFGRFALMSYTMITILCYNIELEKAIAKSTIIGITVHRILAVIVGIIWSIVFTNVLIPIKTEKSLKDNLEIQWMRLGMIWKNESFIVNFCDRNKTRGAHTYELPKIGYLQDTMLIIRSLFDRCNDEIRICGKFRYQL